MHYAKFSHILVLIAQACSFSFANPSEDSSDCLQGNVNKAATACIVLSQAFPGQVYLSNGTNRTNYVAEADGEDFHVV